ncbi:MAG: hypothetical protein ACLR43_01920 [Faecalibacillus faecis]
MWIIRCLAFLYAFSMMEHVLHLQYTATWYYNNPIIILMSAYILYSLWIFILKVK